MELLLLISAYLVGTTALGIATGKVITRRDAGEPARIVVRAPAVMSKRARAPRPRNESPRRP